MSFRLLGSALPLLSVEQLKDVLSGDVMMHYGEHVVCAQVRQQICNIVNSELFTVKVLLSLLCKHALNVKRTQRC